MKAATEIRSFGGSRLARLCSEANAAATRSHAPRRSGWSGGIGDPDNWMAISGLVCQPLWPEPRPPTAPQLPGTDQTLRKFAALRLVTSWKVICVLSDSVITDDPPTVAT